MLDESPQARMRSALEQILRMARTPLNDRETEGSRVWRKDVERIAEKALYPSSRFIK